MGDEAENFNKKLFKHTRKGEWDEVVKIYESDPRKASFAQITEMKDTALHVAIASGKTDVAIKILNIIQDERLEGILNDVGNTPLHLAARQGDARVCKKVKEMGKEKMALVENEKGESAIFLAAMHGKEIAFGILHSMLPPPKDCEHLLKSLNGDTILHVALMSDYFGLAIRILELHPTLADKTNQNGVTPLHILAEKPKAFRSSTPLSYFDRLLYHCVTVNIEVEDAETNQEKEVIVEDYPQNSRTCVFFVAKLIHCIFGVSKKNDKAGDVENPNKKSDHEQPTVLDASSRSTTSNDKPKHETTTQDITGKKLEKESYPHIYAFWVLFITSLAKVFIVVFGIGIQRIKEIKKKKEIHEQARKILNKLVTDNMTYTAGATPGDEHHGFTDDPPNPYDIILSTNVPICPPPILIAAKTGAKEIVEKMLDEYPAAIFDLDEKKKNVVLMAIEYRQPQVYEYLLKLPDILRENVFGQLDVDGNGGLHLAAIQCDDQRPWLIPGSALQMQWEIKWYEFVKASMPRDFFAQRNKAGKTSKTIFLESHQTLVKEGIEWLGKTSESCSLVAALVATVAFATSATVPGGVYQEKGYQEKGTPILRDKPGFHMFAIASLAALCFSITALVFFLSILTSRYQEKDFAESLPFKLLVGLTSLFASIVAMLVSFCSAHLFILQNDILYVAYPLYAALSIPISFFAMAQLSLYYDLVKAIFRKVPQRSYER